MTVETIGAFDPQGLPLVLWTLGLFAITTSLIVFAISLKDRNRSRVAVWASALVGILMAGFTVVALVPSILFIWGGRIPPVVELPYVYSDSKTYTIDYRALNNDMEGLSQKIENTYDVEVLSAPPRMNSDRMRYDYDDYLVRQDTEVLECSLQSVGDPSPSGQEIALICGDGTPSTP